MRQTAPVRRFDHLILGSGQATGTLLGKLIPTGESIAVVEGHKVGGSCVNYGCTPTKALVASAKAIHQARRGEDYGFSTGPIELDFPRIKARMNRIRSNEMFTSWIEDTSNVELIRGWGRFDGAHRIRVGDEVVEADKIYINTGRHAWAPPIEGLDDVPWLDHERALDLEELPGHLIVVGGGYIGVEFAQIFRRFGSEVTILQSASQLMPREDLDVAEVLTDVLRREGVRVELGVKVTRVGGSEGDIQVVFERGDSGETISGSHLVVATGLRPNSANLGLETTCIQTDARGFIVVDDVCRTAVEGVFAVGDVNGKGGFTHTSVNDAEIVLDHLFGGTRRISQRIPVYGLFTDPPLGRVGMSEREALASGRRVLRAIRPMKHIARAREMGETTGFAKLLVDADTDEILGAAILGPGGDEVINMFAAIMHSGTPCRRYREVVLVHPTVSELMPWVLDGLEPIEG